LVKVVNSQNNMWLTAKFVIFLCSVIYQGKTVALDTWGGKWNNLLTTHSLPAEYNAKIIVIGHFMFKLL